MIHLEKISRENWRKAIFITDDPKRLCPLDETWTTSTAFSIVQSFYEEEWESRIIMEDDTIIGFVFYGFWGKFQAPLFCRFTIDIDYQGKGFGQKALPVIIDYIAKMYQAKRIYLTLEEENARAVHIYEKYGFVSTGELDEGEEIYVYHIEEE